MPNLKGSEGFIAIFLLVMVLIGAATGAAIGAALAGSVHLRWLVLLAALSSVIVLGVVRGGFGNSFPKLFLVPRGSPIPLEVWIGAV
jgi:MFS family permease